MTTEVNVSDELIDTAKTNGLISGKTPAEQIEYWAYIGKLMEENPDKTFHALEEDIELANIVRQRQGQSTFVVNLDDL